MEVLVFINHQPNFLGYITVNVLLNLIQDIPGQMG